MKFKLTFKLLFLFLVFVQNLCFSQQEYRAKIIVDTTYSDKDSIDFIDYKKALKEELKYANEKCKKDSLRALVESKSNLTYSLPIPTPAMSEDLFLAEKELIEILRKNNIGYGGYIIGNCFGIPDNCFQWEMNRIIEKKYGINFIENLKHEATKKFVENNPDRIFEFEECDQESRYAPAKTYKEMMDMTDSDYLKKFEYPKDFIFQKKDDKYSHVEASFILDTKGNISKISIELDLKQKKNYIYSSYLINSLKEFIESSKWKTATYKGFPVKSIMRVLIFYK